MIPVMPGRNKKKQLVWDLEDRKGCWTSVDIWCAMKRGYTFELTDTPKDGIHMISWGEKAFVFQNAMKVGNLLRAEGIATKNKVLDEQGKLIHNATYGKTTEVPIMETVKILESDCDKECMEFFQNYDLKSWFPISVDDEPGRVFLGVSGVSVRDNERIKTPVQLGAFVLAYSRQIMLQEFEKVIALMTNEKYGRIDKKMAYRDTDSLMFTIDNEIFEKIKREIIPPKKVNGKMFWDLGEETKVFSAIYLAPKTYMMEYVKRDPNDPQKVILGTKMRAKGMPAKYLTTMMYEYVQSCVDDKLDELDENILADRDAKIELELPDFEIGIGNPRELIEKEFDSIKKIITSMNSKQIDQGLKYMSCVNQQQTRSFFKKFYTGRRYYNYNGKWHSIPWGYDISLLEEDEGKLLSLQ